MSDESSLQNKFIIAMPGLMAPLFYHSVIYICEHTKEGAMGIIVNRPLEINLAEILVQMGFEITNPETYEQPVLCGGPLQMERGFVIHHEGNKWEGSVVLDEEELCISSSREILDDIAHSKGPAESLVALGYAGWEPGQMEKELAENSWLEVPVDAKILFNTPYEERWEKAASVVGVDIKQLASSQIGHA